jgi:hypothetical protein
LFVDPDGTDNILGGNNWLDDDLHIKVRVVLIISVPGI